MSVLKADIMIYGVELHIKEGCLLEAKYAGDSRVIALGLDKAEKCSFINFAETNIPHIELIRRYYVLLAESDLTSETGCQHVAVVVSPEGKLQVGTQKQVSGACGIDKERGHFEYLFNRMSLK